MLSVHVHAYSEACYPTRIGSPPPLEDCMDFIQVQQLGSPLMLEQAH